MEFQQLYDSSPNQRARDVLADGLLTDAEMSELRAAQISCLEALGATVIDLNYDGASSIVPPQGSGDSDDQARLSLDRIEGQCEQQTGWRTISRLYGQVKQNPQNQAMSELMAQCLVRAGLRDPGYTADQYWQEFNSEVFLPWLNGQETIEGQKFKACNLDPGSVQ